MQRYNKCSGTQQWQLIIYHWSTLAIEVERLLFTVVTKHKGEFWWTGFCHTCVYQIWSYAKHFKIYWPVFFITFLIVFVFVPKKNFLQLLDFFKFFTFRLTALIVVQCWLHYVVTLCWKCEQGNGNGSVHLSKCALQCKPA